MPLSTIAKLPLRVTSCCVLSVVLVPLVFGDAVEKQADDGKEMTMPYVLVLGTAQDGGLPQIGCDGPHCTAARRETSRRRFVASLLLADPRTGQRWLIDATPDIREQVELARNHPANRKPKGPRPSLFDGIFLTHAHTGHYTGLIHLGRPAYGAKNVPVHASSRMCGFLTENGPWSFLVSNKNIELHELVPDEPVTLGDNLTITPFLVPHRAEFTDTLGYRIQGPNRSLLYIPDIDKWERWERSIKEAVASVDIALLDGTFFREGEIPGRIMANIPHPFIQESNALFQGLPVQERNKVFFTHLNHGNPATQPDGAAAKSIEEQGMAVAGDGQRFGL